MSASRGCRLHRAGKLALVAGLFHHGDSDRAGSDRVAHRGAGHHSTQGGGDDRHLSGAAGAAPASALARLMKNCAIPVRSKKRAEDDEHHDELGAHVNGAAKNTIKGIEHRPDDLIEGQPNLLYAEGCASHQVEERVDQQHAGNTQNRQSHTSPAQLNQRQHADQSHDHVEVILHDTGRHPNDLVSVDCVEEVGPGPAISSTTSYQGR